MEFLEVSQRAAGEVAVEWVVEESDRLLDNGRSSNNDLVGFVGVFFFFLDCHLCVLGLFN